MSDIDELPSWAGRAVRPGEIAPSNVPTPAPAGPPPRRRRGLVVGALGLLILAGGAVAGWWIVNEREGSVSTAGPGTTAPSGEDDGADVSAGASITTATTAASAATSSSAPTSAPVAEPSTSGSVTSDDIVTDPSMVSDDNPTGAVRYEVLSGGKLYLRGKVPTPEVGAYIEEVAGTVMGPENVFNEFEIDPSVPVEVPGPLYVEDVVLFGFNSVEVEPAFLPILDLGTSLLVQYPEVKITVVARTDSIGSEAANLEVSRQRAQAVINYWINKGIDPNRLIADARGESEASGEENNETAALDRRAEFIISGLFG